MKQDDRKKVGLVTCFLDNYGACLQAYALQSVIEKIGFCCEIIRFTEPNGYEKNISKPSFIRRIKESKCYYVYRCAVDASYAEAKKLKGRRPVFFRRFREKRLHLTSENYNTYESLVCAGLQYDAFICGSDQIWNPTFYGKCNPAYYLAFVADGIKRIAYAPSIGLSRIPDEYQDEFKRYIQRLDFVSCREKIGCDQILQLTGRSAQHVLDPTFLLNRSDWEKIIRYKKRKPYIFCYLFGQNPYYTQFIDMASKHFNCDVLYIPIFKEDLNNKYQKLTDEGPAEFISLIKNAEYIITDSFHAIVFSVIFEKNFSVFLRDSAGNPNSMNSRIDSILSKLELRDRLVTPENFSQVSFDPVDHYANVFRILDLWRSESIAFLKEALRND